MTGTETKSCEYKPVYSTFSLFRVFIALLKKWTSCIPSGTTTRAVTRERSYEFEVTITYTRNYRTEWQSTRGGTGYRAMKPYTLSLIKQSPWPKNPNEVIKDF